MKALWIRVEAHEVDSPRIEELAQALEVDDVTALGHYVALGGQIAEHCPDGHIGAVGDAKLEHWARWRGETGRFAGAIRRLFQSRGGEFSDWTESMGKLVERRAADRDRAEQRRKGGKKSTDSPPTVHGQSADSRRTIVRQSAATDGTDGTDGTERDVRSPLKTTSGVVARENGQPPASLRSESKTATAWHATLDRWLDRYYPVVGPKRADKQRQLQRLAVGDILPIGKGKYVQAYTLARLVAKCEEMLEENSVRDLDLAIAVLFTKLGDTSDGSAPGEQEAQARRDERAESADRSDDPWPTTIGDTLDGVVRSLTDHEGG